MTYDDCYVDIGKVETDEMGRLPRPSLPLLKAQVEYHEKRVDVTALIDTGADITIVEPAKIKELEELLGLKIPIIRSVRYYGANGTAELVPAFDLRFVFPRFFSFTSTVGVIAPEDWEFDVAELWLGQDILGKLVVEFDGTSKRVTVTASPN